MKSKTKGKAYGCDISADLIDIAKHQNKDEYDITYMVKDCSQPLDLPIKFDIVACTYLICYADTEALMEQFCRVCFEALKPGGKLVGVTINPWLDASKFPTMEKYDLYLTGDHNPL